MRAAWCIYSSHFKIFIPSSGPVIIIGSHFFPRLNQIHFLTYANRPDEGPQPVLLWPALNSGRDMNPWGSTDFFRDPRT